MGIRCKFCTAIKRDLQNVRGVTNASIFSSQYFQLCSPFPVMDFIQEKQVHIPYILQPSFSSFTLHTCIAYFNLDRVLVIAVAFTEKVTLYKFGILL